MRSSLAQSSSVYSLQSVLFVIQGLQAVLCLQWKIRVSLKPLSIGSTIKLQPLFSCDRAHL